MKPGNVVRKMLEDQKGISLFSVPVNAESETAAKRAVRKYGYKPHHVMTIRAPTSKRLGFYEIYAEHQ